MPTTYSNFISGFATAAMTYDRDGFVYANTGEVIDVRDPAAPHRVGTFAGGGPQLPASRSDDALRVSESPGKLDIELLDAKTFTSVSALHIASTFDQIGPLALIGTNRIAVAGSTTGFGRGVYLTRNAPDPNPAPVQVAPIAGSGVIEVPIAARALVADPVRQVLYAAVAAGAPAYENRLVTIDPKNGAIVGSVPVGSDPVAMSLSDDASTLWVSLAGASAVRRVDLTKGVPVPGPPHDLPYSVVGQDVIALPGRPNSVVVVLYSRNVAGQGFSGAVFLDDGLLRPGFPTS